MKQNGKAIGVKDHLTENQASFTNKRKWFYNGNTPMWFYNRTKPSWLEFMLVRNLLVALVFLVTLVIILPFLLGGIINYDNNANIDVSEIIDFSKWILTALLAAFGAWIGAGAAYFFGKENLLASNKSTQEALELQKKSEKENSLVLDVQPMPLNPSFQFNLDSDVEEVLKKLGENVDYWFVPIIENERLQDTLHTEAFWRFRQKNKIGKVKDVIKFIEEDENLKGKKSKLHGFYLEVKMDDLIHEVSDKMNKNHATVGIVCDNKDRPTHCFSMNDLKSFKLGSS